jgi:hypothetical protein
LCSQLRGDFFFQPFFRVAATLRKIMYFYGHSRIYLVCITHDTRFRECKKNTRIININKAQEWMALSNLRPVRPITVTDTSYKHKAQRQFPPSSSGTLTVELNLNKHCQQRILTPHATNNACTPNQQEKTSTGWTAYYHSRIIFKQKIYSQL